jgi:hypothetical protein
MAVTERCSVREAALKLHEWFKIGESDDSQTEHEKHRSAATDVHDSMKDLVAEIKEHCAQIAYHASELQAKTTAVKEIVSLCHREFYRVLNRRVDSMNWPPVPISSTDCLQSSRFLSV